MIQLGRLLIAFGVLLLVVGALVLLIGRLGLPLGHLPGDVEVHRKRFTFYAPIATCLLLSVLISLLLCLAGLLRR